MKFSIVYYNIENMLEKSSYGAKNNEQNNGENLLFVRTISTLFEILSKNYNSVFLVTDSEIDKIKNSELEWMLTRNTVDFVDLVKKTIVDCLKYYIKIYYSRNRDAGTGSHTFKFSDDIKKKMGLLHLGWSRSLIVYDNRIVIPVLSFTLSYISAVLEFFRDVMSDKEFRKVIQKPTVFTDIVYDTLYKAASYISDECDLDGLRALSFLLSNYDLLYEYYYGTESYSSDLNFWKKSLSKRIAANDKIRNNVNSNLVSLLILPFLQTVDKYGLPIREKMIVEF